MRREVATILALGLVVAGVLVTNAGAGVANWRAKPIGNAHGIALFARVHAAYLRVPGVELSVASRGSTISSSRRFVLRLRAGVAVAEEFVSSGTDGTVLAARRGGPTYAREAGKKCWRRLALSNPRTLQDVGLPYPYGRLPGKAMAPRRTAGAWLLPTENRENFWFLATQTVYKPTAKRFITYKIDAKSGRLRSIFIQALRNGTMNVRARTHPKTIWLTARLNVTTLSSTPRLPNPTPAC